MTNKDFNTLINKYAILIGIGYGLDFLILTIIQRLIPTPNTGNYDIIGLLTSSTWIIQFIVNFIAAMWVYKDMKLCEIKNKLIVVMTLLFSLLGVTMFFITINRENKKAST